MDESRKQFESWHVARGTPDLYISKLGNEYYFLQIEAAWQAWDASRKTGGSRKEFENWISNDTDFRFMPPDKYSYLKRKGEDYASVLISIQWQAWKASRQALQAREFDYEQ